MQIMGKIYKWKKIQLQPNQMFTSRKGGYPIYINKSDKNHWVRSFDAQYMCIHTLLYIYTLYNKAIANNTVVTTTVVLAISLLYWV